MRRMDGVPNRGEAQRGVSVVLAFPEPRGGHFGDGEINLWEALAGLGDHSIESNIFGVPPGWQEIRALVYTLREYDSHSHISIP